MTISEFANLQEAFVVSCGRSIEVVLAVYLVLVSLAAMLRIFPWQRIIDRVNLDR